MARRTSGYHKKRVKGLMVASTLGSMPLPAEGSTLVMGCYVDCAAFGGAVGGAGGNLCYLSKDAWCDGSMELGLLFFPCHVGIRGLALGRSFFGKEKIFLKHPRLYTRNKSCVFFSTPSTSLQIHNT